MSLSDTNSAQTDLTSAFTDADGAVSVNITCTSEEDVSVMAVLDEYLTVFASTTVHFGELTYILNYDILRNGADADGRSVNSVNSKPFVAGYSYYVWWVVSDSNGRQGGGPLTVTSSSLPVTIEYYGLGNKNKYFDGSNRISTVVTSTSTGTTTINGNLPYDGYILDRSVNLEFYG